MRLDLKRKLKSERMIYMLENVEKVPKNYANVEEVKLALKVFDQESRVKKQKGRADYEEGS